MTLEDAITIIMNYNEEVMQKLSFYEGVKPCSDQEKAARIWFRAVWTGKKHAVDKILKLIREGGK